MTLNLKRSTTGLGRFRECSYLVDNGYCLPGLQAARYAFGKWTFNVRAAGRRLITNSETLVSKSLQTRINHIEVKVDAALCGNFSQSGINAQGDTVGGDAVPSTRS